MINCVKTDLHVHTSFSWDSQASMEEQTEAAIKNGIKAVCFTDHVQFGRYNTVDKFDFAGRRAEFARLKAKFEEQITLLFGQEVGEPNAYPNDYQKLLSADSYDMIIGSVHGADGKMFPEIENRVAAVSKEQYARTYEMVKKGGFEVLGHLDFPKKFIKDFVEDEEMSYAILDEIIKKGIVLEVNTSSMRYSCVEPCPSFKMIDYYASCGGEFVTINSDCHESKDLGYKFEEVLCRLPKNLKLCYFVNRQLVVNG